MKLIKYILLLIFISNTAFSQEKSFLKEFSRYELGDENFLNDFNHFDFANIWTRTKENSIYGVIGENHQRIRMKFLSIKRNFKDENQYIVYGKSKLGNNICDFKGMITLKKILKAKGFDNGVDQMYKDKLEHQGILIADYRFEEDKNQYGSGVFKGKIYSKWVIYKDKQDKISYDNIADYSDGYANNSFIGVWKNSKTKKTKKCNWGDWRVPMANDDFDGGAGDFSPSDKYLKFGWKNYRKAITYNDEQAKKIEHQVWWED